MSVSELPLNYKDAVEYLYGRINYERNAQFPTAPRASMLQRTRELAHRIDDPQNDYAIIHIAGTKGKGSTSAMIASMLTAAGYRTGLYTSPHLDRIEQRMTVDGAVCSGDDLASLITDMRPAIEEMDRAQDASDGLAWGPTFFEIMTVVAMLPALKPRKMGLCRSTLASRLAL